MALFNLWKMGWRMDAKDRRIILAGKIFEPVHHILALVGVVNEHIRARNRFDPVGFCQRCNSFEIGPHIAGQVTADVRRVTRSIGLRNRVHANPRGAQHGAMILGEKDFKTHGAQNFSRTNRGTPRHLALRITGRLVQIEEIVLHDLFHIHVIPS